MKRKIGNKQIGEGESCFTIAEAGSNHNGNLEQAKELIDVAAEAKAGAVEFQIFKAENKPEEDGSSNDTQLTKAIQVLLEQLGGK